MDQRTPMSERQQLAIIKKLERSQQEPAHPHECANATGAAAALTSPPRLPLQPVNAQQASLSAQTAASAKDTTTLSTPNPGQSRSWPSSASPSPSFAEERLRRRILRRNAKGETLLHRAAIKGNAKCAAKMLQLGVNPNETDNAGKKLSSPW